MKRPYFICDQVPACSQSGSGWPSQRFDQPAAGERAVGEQLHAARAGTGPTSRPPRADRAARTPPGSRPPRCRSRAPCCRCAVSTLVRPRWRDQSLALQLLQVEQRVEPARIGVGPGVELQQVDPARRGAARATLDRRPHVLARERPGLRHPLREQLHGGAPPGPSRQMARDDLGRSVVIGHVERR